MSLEIKLLRWGFIYCREIVGAPKTVLWVVLTFFYDLVHGRLNSFYRQVCVFNLPKKTQRRIMLVSSDNDPGSGAFRCLVSLARTLRDDCHEDVFVVLPSCGKGDFLLDEAKVPYVCVPSSDWIVSLSDNLPEKAQSVVKPIFRNHFAIRRLIRLIKELDVDVVHCNTIYTYVGALAAHYCNVPVVWHIREYITEGAKGRISNERMGFELMSKSSCIVTVSDWVRSKYVNILPVDKLKTVYDGVDSGRFYCSDHVAGLGNQMTLISVGSYRPYKGYDRLARACAELYKEGVRNFRLWFVGGGIKEHIGNFFESAGMVSAVTYLGFQDAPERFVQRADIAFTCCPAEAFGLVTVEALMSGCCVIGVNAAATPEIVQDLKTGMLFENDNESVEGLKTVVRTLLESPALVKKLANAGREYAVKNFTLELNAFRMRTIYDDVLSAAKDQS